MAFLTHLSALTAVVVSVAAAPQNVPPTMVGDVQLLGHTSDPGFAKTPNASNPYDPGYYTDGGAGGYVNSYHLVTISDGRIHDGFGEVHTAYAFTDPTNPINITIVGDYTSDPPFFLQGNGDGQGAVRSNPTDACNETSNPNFAPGPNTMMVPLDNSSSTGINVWSVYCGSVQYNTLIEWDVQDLEGLVAESQQIPNTRTVNRLFNATQPLYGTDGIATDDQYIYMVARNDSGGFKLTRVEKDQRTDITKYNYYYPTANEWNATLPATDNNDANFFVGTNPGNGVQFGSDLFFSPYFNTWMFSYSSFGLSAIYNLAYSSTGLVEGPYTDLGPVYTPPLDSSCNSDDPYYVPDSATGIKLVYLTHSHPGYDTTGKTLTIGWISCDTFINFGKMTFK